MFFTSISSPFPSSSVHYFLFLPCQMSYNNRTAFALHRSRPGSRSRTMSRPLRCLGWNQSESGISWITFPGESHVWRSHLYPWAGVQVNSLCWNQSTSVGSHFPGNQIKCRCGAQSPVTSHLRAAAAICIPTFPPRPPE